MAASIIAAAGNTPLIDAVKQSDTAAIRALLQKRVDVNAAEPDGTTALHWAASRNDLEIVNLLIGAGASVRAANRYGVTPLLLACKSASLPVVERLLTAGADPKSALPEGETALMTAARAGKADVIRTLAARGADVNAREGWHGQTALMWAAADNHAPAISALVELGADVNARSSGGFTALLFAVRAGRTSAVETLLRHGARVNDKIGLDPAGAGGAVGGTRNLPGGGAGAGTSALVLAVTNAHYALATLLLETGADPNAADQGWTALHQLQYTRRHTRARGLPPPEQTGTVDSLTLARTLFARGANLNARQTHEISDGQRNALNRLGATPYLLAAKHADAPMMRLLAQHGADVRAMTEGMATPLQVAAGTGVYAPGESVGTNEEAFEAVKAAYELGDTAVDAADDRGWTALHGGAFRGSNEIVQYLVAKGASFEPKTRKEGWTALNIADGVYFNGTFKRNEPTAALMRQLMKARGLPVPPPPSDKPELLNPRIIESRQQ